MEKCEVGGQVWQVRRVHMVLLGGINGREYEQIGFVVKLWWFIHRLHKY